MIYFYYFYSIKIVVILHLCFISRRSAVYFVLSQIELKPIGSTLFKEKVSRQQFLFQLFAADCVPSGCNKTGDTNFIDRLQA